MIDRHSIEQVVDRVDIVDVVSRYVDLKRQGSNYVACCPFHNERTPSFVVNPSRNTWHCFGACNEGGDAISFVMHYCHLNFPDAVRELAKMVGVQLDESEEKGKTAEQKMNELKHESMFAAYRSLQPFFVEQLEGDSGESRQAKAYATKRWNADFVRETGIGYAPRDSRALIDFAKRHNIPENILLELGVLRKSEKDGRLYAFFRERIMIPIRDRFSRIIGYTARYIGDSPDTAKYLNSATSLIYSKESSIFGIHIALRAAAKENKFYLVEGAPDVLRLQLIEANNVIASLGSAWTERQLSQIKRYSTNLCFLPDADPPKPGEQYGTGIVSVIKNGLLAFRLGFNITVKEIPPARNGAKNDPDSYCRSRAIVNDIDEEDFFVWYARKLFAGSLTQEQKRNAVTAIASLIAQIDDEVKQSMYLESVAKIEGSKSLWKTAINTAKQQLSKKSLQASDRDVNLDLLNKYGFQEKDNCYFSITNDGKTYRWSNFTMKPLFHIKHPVMAIRLYQITNENGQTDTIELKQEELVSLTKFRLRVEGLGNYLWFAKEAELNKLKSYLYDDTESAVRIDQLGWQRQGFFAFGNGIFDTEWHPADDLGIVRLGDRGTFYLPAFSSIYRNDTQLYQYERCFAHFGNNNISLHDYCEKFVEVFGDNAKVGIAFLIATLFRDVVVQSTVKFPILNVLGPKGSGKSAFCEALTAFFTVGNKAPSIVNATIPSLAEAIGQCANAFVHLEEFKNNIELERREILKSIYDGIGRSKMNLERDKKREMARVDSGVIVSGQEMATADIALFSPFIFLAYNTSEFSTEAKARFDALLNISARGCTHLTMELLRYRKRFETEFHHSWKVARGDVELTLGAESIEDRHIKNWTTLLAAFRTLSDVLDFSFRYDDLLQVVVAGIRRQNDATKKNNELSNFWNIVSFLHQDGKIWLGGDYRIETEDRLKCSGHTEMVFPSAKKVLYLRYKRVFELYKSHGKMVNEPLLPSVSLMYYLEHSPMFYGKKRSVRFKQIVNGVEVATEKDNGYGTKQYVKTYAIDQAMCFDYDLLNEAFDVNLEDLT